MKKLLSYLLVACTAFLAWQCKKEPFENPFNNPDLVIPPDTVNQVPLVEGSFPWLHQKVFKPTCSNSGCHDGTFEPDFTTIESSYNTLVYQPVIKNNAQQSYEYRVMPGNAVASVLVNRITTDIDGQSGIMPLSIDPGSDWPNMKAEYVTAIRNWIDAGAPNQFGQFPTAGNQVPQMTGVLAFADAQPTPLPRAPGNGPLLVPPGTQTLSIWIGFSDDSTAVNQFLGNTIRFSTSANSFSGSNPQPLSIAPAPLNALGYFGANVDYWHSIQFDPYQFGSLNEEVFFRAEIGDGDNPLLEIPGNGSLAYIKSYFSYKIDP